MATDAVYALGGRRLCSAGVPESAVRYHVWRGLAIALVLLFSLGLLPRGVGVTQFAWLSLIVVRRVVASSA